MSDDGRFALVTIAMLGAVFSPYYARARARGASQADPLAHVTMNVSVYTPKAKLWALTERGSTAVARTGDALAIGPSSLRWEQGALVAELSERTAPFGARLAGRVRLTPAARDGQVTFLDGSGRHRWAPIAPAARAEVVLTHPPLRFSGAAYMDANEGDEGLEDAFVRWTWSRVATRGGAAIAYEIDRRDGTTLRVSRAFERGLCDAPALVSVSAPDTRWGLARVVHVERGSAATVLRTLEDTPFYARSMIERSVGGERAIGMHETLSLDRFRSPIVQRMLPFRMRRERA